MSDIEDLFGVDSDDEGNIYKAYTSNLTRIANFDRLSVIVFINILPTFKQFFSDTIKCMLWAQHDCSNC